MGDELCFSTCFWVQRHPGESVPLKAVTSEKLGEADPVLSVARPSQSEPHDDKEPSRGAEDTSTGVPAGAVKA